MDSTGVGVAVLVFFGGIASPQGIAESASIGVPVRCLSASCAGLLHLDVAPAPELAPVVHGRRTTGRAPSPPSPSVGPGDFCVPDTSTINVRSTSPSYCGTSRTRKSGTYSWLRPWWT